jgi:hypothetical protein
MISAGHGMPSRIDKTRGLCIDNSFWVIADIYRRGAADSSAETAKIPFGLCSKPQHSYWMLNQRQSCHYHALIEL